MTPFAALYHPFHSNNDKVSGKCPDLNGNYISFLSPIFTAAVTDVGLLSLFVISIPQNEMKMTVKKVLLINFPTPDKRHIRFILCTWLPILFVSAIFGDCGAEWCLISEIESFYVWMSTRESSKIVEAKVKDD